MSSDKIVVLASFVPKPGLEGRVEEVLRGMLAPTRSEPGNEMYDLCTSEVDGRSRFHLLERYADPSALDAHRQTEHYRSYRAAIVELLDADIDVMVMTGADVV